MADKELKCLKKAFYKTKANFAILLISALLDDRKEIQYMDKVFKNGLSKFFKDCLPQNVLSPLMNTLSHILLNEIKNKVAKKC